MKSGKVFRVVARLVVCGWVVAMTAPAASAALSLQIGPHSTPGEPDVLPMPGRGFFDVVFNETPPAENEGLFAYDLGFQLIRPPGTPQVVRLDGAERPDNFVLDVPSGSTFIVAESTPDCLLINVSSNNDLADITAGKKAARIFYTFDPGFCIQGTRVVFDTSSTVFGSGDPNRPLEIAVDLSDAGVFPDCPEPGGLALLGAAGLLTLRRRLRRAA